ncbi:MAG: 23S rRNA (pseudouridine(1915)-N(3))-methyltransferase RlmH [Chitinophagales bacterium]|nr:23S rRNA (pseudouridine(1915)-N(3))-methyltransferase RlmH [Chitinophagales bacterium]
MKVKLLVIGKTTQSYVDEGCSIFFNRLQHYTNFEFQVIQDKKNINKLQIEQRKQEEGTQILKVLLPTDFVVLLDEKGRSFTSVKFAKWIEQQQLNAVSQIVFVVGGAYGFAPEIYERANMKMQLSSMTFSHQLIRLIFAEQLYRAFTIIKGEPYHNE